MCIRDSLITAKSEPVFGCVYKLAAIEDQQGNIIPKIKISENAAKITTPHFKKVYRIFDKSSGKAQADLVAVYDEIFDDSQPLTIFDPEHPWKKKTFTNYYMQELLVPIFKAGKRV